jgi:hypothetical protein
MIPVLREQALPQSRAGKETPRRKAGVCNPRRDQSAKAPAQGGKQGIKALRI